jgi:hypothetical protein
MTQTLNPAEIVALQFEEDMYLMLRRAGVPAVRIDQMRAARIDQIREAK